MKVLGGMLVFGGVAAAHMAANQAKAEMHPSVAHFCAFAAFMGVRVFYFDLIQVSAILGHVVLFPFKRRAVPTRQFCSRRISSLCEFENLVARKSLPPYFIVHEQKFAHLLVIERSGG